MWSAGNAAPLLSGESMTLAATGCSFVGFGAVHVTECRQRAHPLVPAGMTRLPGPDRDRRARRRLKSCRRRNVFEGRTLVCSRVRKPSARSDSRPTSVGRGNCDRPCLGCHRRFRHCISRGKRARGRCTGSCSVTHAAQDRGADNRRPDPGSDKRVEQSAPPYAHPAG